MKKHREPDVPNTNYVEYVGYCPCGCGSFKCVLFDHNDRPIAAFGFDYDGWQQFFKNVSERIEQDRLN